MTTLKLSIESETFLRYLAAPRSFQLTYPQRTFARYGYEGRESYGEAAGGLPLLFLVGEDYTVRDLQRIAHLLDERDERVNDLFQLTSLVRFVSESGDVMMMVMDIDNEDEMEYYPSGVWQLLRNLAQRILIKMGVESSPPAQSYEQIFVERCFIVNCEEDSQ